MMRGLPNIYGLLTPKERFSAVLAAIGRGDDDEVGRLHRTCPRVTYRMEDAAFSDPLDRSYNMARSFSMAVLDTLISVHVLKAGRELTRLRAVAVEQGFSIGLKAAGGLPEEEHPVWQEIDQAVGALGETEEQFGQALTGRLIELKSLDAGYRRFCRDVGLDAGAVLGWCPLVSERLEAVSDLLLSVEPDSEVEVACYEAFRAIWDE
jgi:hypothetical protein